MQWIESKYACLLSSRVRNYKRKAPTLWNFSCPLCDDSETNKKKARGYIYEKKGHLRFHCHNCAKDLTFDKFIREVDESLYLEMKKELFEDFKEQNKSPATDFAAKMKKPEFIRRTNISELQKVSQLSPNHFCKKYVVKRKIPNFFHSQLFFAPRFLEWTNSMIPGKFDEKALAHDKPRLVIPFLDSTGELIGYQGRSFEFDERSVKYLTIMLNEDKPRVYGLDRVNFNKRWYCVEGPIDAMFVENCIATAGADIISELERVKPVKDNGVIVYDNEPRNRDTLKKMRKAIRKGWKIVIWPSSPEGKEDINDLIKLGIDPMITINQHIYSGLQAELAMAQWQKV